MEQIILLAVVGALNIACFFIGAKIGQTVAKGEPIEAPNPVQTIREHKEYREQERYNSRINAILENIDNYDGTSVGQKKIPRR